MEYYFEMIELNFCVYGKKIIFVCICKYFLVNNFFFSYKLKLGMFCFYFKIFM